MATANAVMNMRDMVKNGLGVPVFMVMLLAMLIVPLPPLALDVLFTFSIALSLVVILAVVYTPRPMEFAAFPTILLLTTLLRLALNVASTRVVLLHGHTGTDAAGKVIKAFGDFVVGGNYAVGMVVFSILVIINFVVVTKGAGRISEVSARFTLDAMPGKQMAIDADLNAGLITQEEARVRRGEVTREADFYGAMDGASKFVRGDAVAGVLIIFINIIGGFIVGTVQHDLSFGEALHNYTLLTIGDGLVAQIPSLVLSTAAAIIVTRMSSAQNMSEQILTQMFDDPRTLAVTAAVLGAIGIVPGMPNVAFLTLAILAGAASYMIAQRKKSAVAPAVAPLSAPITEVKELGWDDVTMPDIIGLEVGYRLIPLVDTNQGGQLMARIKGVRKKLSQDLGFLVPAVHIRDNLELPPGAYRITLLGAVIDEVEIYPERQLAINPGRKLSSLQGIATRDPAFGLEAVWIDAGLRDQAQTLGYTVVDPATVIATHLSQMIQMRAHEVLGRDEVQQLLNNLAKTAPKLAEDLSPKALPLGVVVKVLQNLLEEHVPIRDLRTIAETLALHAAQSQDPGVLTNYVRIALGRIIVQSINGIAQELPVITLDPGVEQLLQQSIHTAGNGDVVMEPGLVERLRQTLTESTQRQTALGQPAVLVVAAPIRAWIARFARQVISGLHVLSYNEIPDSKRVRVIATVSR
jgi:flagellar biosynthesis protein FlhA